MRISVAGVGPPLTGNPFELLPGSTQRGQWSQWGVELLAAYPPLINENSSSCIPGLNPHQFFVSASKTVNSLSILSRL